MQQFEAELTLKLKAPFLFPGVDAGRFGFDRVAIRNADDRIIIPQDQIRGLMRHGLVALDRKDEANRLFGFGSGDDDAASYEPKPGLVNPADLVAVDEAGRSFPFHRVRINEKSGAAEEGHLLVVEQVFPAEKEVTFVGQLIFFAQDADDAREIGESLALAMSVWDAIGAYVSIGFGRISSMPSVVISKMHDLEVEPGEEAEILSWEFDVDRPYIVDSQRLDGNTFLGQKNIPGGALKGLLARAIALRGIELSAEGLSKLRIGFASRSTELPRAASIVKRGNDEGEMVDRAFLDQLDFTPVPQVDWKSEEAEDEVFDERVHTAIENGGAKDQALFSEVAIRPTGQPFVAKLDLSGLANNDRAALGRALAVPLPGLGRTNAVIATRSLQQVTKPAHLAQAGRVAVLLASNGLLADSSDGATPMAAYSSFWNQLLSGSTMVSCFAEQVFAGGYQAQRFGPKKWEYRPWMLTKAGAVFVFDLVEQDVDRLQQLLRTGVCRETLDGENLTWENCPFVSENGYGELALHTILEPVQ